MHKMRKLRGSMPFRRSRDVLREGNIMSDTVKMIIDGKEITAHAGETVLNAASRNGIEIPNLCYLKELSPYGACGVCVVEQEGYPKLLRACSAKVTENAVIRTDSEKCLKARRLALELLMGDHDADCKGPCTLNCPAGTDCQRYVAEIADGDFAAATRTVKEKVPLPASVGRVCPHPCETACRRKNADEAISIAFLKAFAADRAMESGAVTDGMKSAPTGKTVGIIGGGPAGLSAAYRLALYGHKVTIYDKMPKAGGMLRYGIPEYRLPKAVLDAETDAIFALGVEFCGDTEIGKDIPFDEIRAKHDAVLVANGAWKSVSLRCKGEELDGVFGGIDFLRETALGNAPAVGKSCAVVGGGNTAMDACRTAVRLGAENVYVIYRRTRNEMPAEDIEISEAEEEGVVFRFLSNPAEIVGENGHVNGVVLQKMRLGEPDERGRRAPVPVDGETELLPLDSIIIAAGQKNDPSGFEALPKTKRGTIEADIYTLATSLDGVFAAGDTTNNGASVAIDAIAEANTAAKYIDAYLNGIEIPYKRPVLSERRVRPEMFEDVQKEPRAVMPCRAPSERRKDFKEINLGFSAEEAVREAKRCLDCGCREYGNCRLIKYADEYDIDCVKFTGEFHPGFKERRLLCIERNQNKCILCNACVRVCESTGKGLLGLVGRGFDTVIRPEFNNSDAVKDCVNCRKCVDACPTGALRFIGE